LSFLLLAGSLLAQASANVNFANDILPIFRQSCLGCHGPAVQQASLRLDRKSSVMKPLSRRVSPGSSANSFLYHRVSGAEYGMQMPPTGALKPEQIALIKAWIDQGAKWPDSLANEKDLPPFNPQAISMVEWLRNNDLAAFMNAASADPSLLNARGPEGSTPFMYATLYSNAATLQKLLQLGADPNTRNDVNATALMWAARNFEKTKLLVEHGADVNAKSDDLRTPLMIAARRVGGARIVKFLLDRKANPNPNPKPDTESSPLLEALIAGDSVVVDMLLRAGADAKATADTGLTIGASTPFAKCLDLIVSKITDKKAYTASLPNIASMGDVRTIRLMLDHGADVNAADPFGRTPLMYVAVSDVQPVEAIKLLIERGADVNAKDTHKNSGDSGSNVLDIAKGTGNPEIIRLLIAAGAKASPVTPLAWKPRLNNTARNAVQDSLPLIQRADANFATKAGCFSCHNNSMTAMAVSLARSRGLRIDEETASKQLDANVKALAKSRDTLHQGFVAAVGDNFGDFVFGYLLTGLHAEGYRPDLNTDAAALYILSHQTPRGDWPYPHGDNRPPICLNYVTQTALALRALQFYAPKPAKAEADKAIRLATIWLANAKSASNEDRSWRLTGLAWAGTDNAATKEAMKELLEAQHPDGGWSELPAMGSTAFSTGESLVALQLAGLSTSDPALQRGVKYLLGTQQQDGSWYVKTRALGFQPGFDAGFPHGTNQWISTAGTSWAAMALSLTLPEAGPVVALQRP